MSLSSDAVYRVQRARNSWAAAAAGWAEQRAAGSPLVSRICAVRGAALERAGQPWETDSAAADSGYPAPLAEPCRRLSTAAASLHQQLERLRTAADTLAALGRLEEAAAGRGGDAAAPPTAWDAARCAAAAARLLPLYVRETEVKRTVAAWLAHADSPAALTAFRAAWTHDAYLTEETLALQQCLSGEVVLDAGVAAGTPLSASPAALASPALRQRRS